MKFKDWGKLSREFLELEGTDEVGEIMSLISALWNTNYNMMELINSEKFAFKQTLETKQQKELKALEEFGAEDLDEFYFSAPVKRMVWQTLRIIKELRDVLGEDPKRIFIEMTRSDGEKGDAGRKDSRKKMFLDLYKNIQNEDKDWKKLIEDEDASGRLRSKKMYLYLTQMGRCMYTGNHIDLDKLFDKNYYDIDHIYPRSQVKDDNLANNLVLVEKEINANKSDIYPLDRSIRENRTVQNLWKTLKGKKLITEEKYHRLIGTQSFTDEQKADFIARQLVETSQGTKGVAELLKQLIPESTIVYAKAGNVSDFRNNYNLIKCRTVNDFHHAHDAYLNIVVGNVYYVKFTQTPLNFIRNELKKDAKKNHYNLGRMFDWDVRRNDETAWLAKAKDKEGTIATVKRMMEKNTPLMTRMSFEGHGAIANETLYGADAAKDIGYIPLKSSDDKMKDVKKYGGFTSVSTAYFFLVEHEIKGKRIRTIETVPVYLKDKIETDREKLLIYCEKQLGLVNPSIRLPKIKIQSLIKWNGYPAYLSGKTGKRFVLKNAVNMKLEQNWIEYLICINKSVEQKNIHEKITKEDNIRLYDILTDKHQNQIFKKRPNAVGDKLATARDKFEELELMEQCEIISEIMNLSIIGNTVANLSLVGLAPKTGVMLISKLMTKNESMHLINQSVTGIYETSIDLLTI